MTQLRVMIGYDPVEHEAAMVAAKSLREVTHGEIEPEFLCLPKLVDQGLIWRQHDARGGQRYDFVSQSTQSTEFSVSRFLTPILAQGGFALFLDCDMVFMRDPREMLDTVSARCAVNVVKHNHPGLEPSKMCGLEQTRYPRKNWSSVMLFNCDHASNRRLSLRDVNERPGRDLHAFYWLGDDEIGALDPKWNYLVDVQERPAEIGIAHLTLGGPWFGAWQGGSFDAEWLAARDKP
jgi:hypothetical protein